MLDFITTMPLWLVVAMLLVVLFVLGVMVKQGREVSVLGVKIGAGGGAAATVAPGRVGAAPPASAAAPSATPTIAIDTETLRFLLTERAAETHQRRKEVVADTEREQEHEDETPPEAVVCIKNSVALMHCLQTSEAFLISSLAGHSILLGRNPVCDLVFADQYVSRTHARLEWIPSSEAELEFRIVDLNSTNGTFVNGEKVSARQLLPGDLINLGPVELRFVPLI